MPILLYSLGSVLVLSFLLDLRVTEPARYVAFGILRILLMVPLLAGSYLYFSFDTLPHLIAPLLFSENVFCLTWILMAYRLQTGPNPASLNPFPYRLFVLIGGTLVLAAGAYGLLNPPAVEIVDDLLVLPHFGQVYISAFFMLMAAFYMAWRLEKYWRALNPQDRWRTKYLVVGFFLISGSFFWCASYRLSYMCLVDNHFLLLSILLLIAWLFVSYSVARYRLLNRKIFVSRKVVYSAVAPTIFAGYLIFLGIATIMMRAFGWSLHFVLQWLLIILGLLLITVLALSSKFRKSVKYFISTHFYVNKYEYRDEWLAFSNLLRGIFTKHDVVKALLRILKESLYTDTIMIWIGDAEFGFRRFDEGGEKSSSPHAPIPADDPFVRYLSQMPSVLDIHNHAKDPERQSIVVEKNDFFLANGLVLVAPVTIGGQLIGFVGLGPEYTGGRYGQDDYDLLTALCSQAASALLAVRMAEDLAHAREKSAWETLSAFVLHDIKNAATMLKLVKENASANIHKPAFQQDMLAAVDDALKRMDKVQHRLKTLKGELRPKIMTVDIGRLVRDCSHKLARKLPDLTIDAECRQNPTVQTDPDMIVQIFENLMINALEAGGPGTHVHVKISITDSDRKTVQLEINDNGPGIPTDMMPDHLFDPFKTTKPNGGGIGLWQVKRLVESLGGTIDVENLEGGGAKFVVRLPTEITILNH